MIKKPNRGKQFIKDVKPNEKLAIIHHKDADGSYSAAVAAIALKRLGVKVSKIIGGTVERADEIIESLKGYDKIILIDIAIDYLSEELEKLNKKMLFIDHHPPVKDINSDLIVYINPRLERANVYQPASYVVYKFFSEFVDLSDKEWLAVVGTIGDYGYEDCRDLLDNHIKVKEKRDIWKTKYGKAAIVTIGAASQVGFSKLIDILVKAENINSLMKNKEIKIGFKKYIKLYNEAKGLFWKNAEKYDDLDLIFSVIDSKIERVGSAISTELATKYPNKLIMLLERVGDFYKIHARYQNGKFHLGMLLRNLGVGGGHEKAGGGKVKIKELDVFRESFLKELKAVKSSY